MNIYVVDDDPITTMMVGKLLTDAGHRVDRFPDGAAAWAAFQERPVPLVVTDWLMPEMSGIELTKAIRKHPDVPYTNIVLITALAVGEHAGEAFEAGVDDMLGKPIDPIALKRRVAATERAQLEQTEWAMRKSLAMSQNALGVEHVNLVEVLGELADVSRRRKAYVRCRAFVRRQLAIANESFGSTDARTKKLAGELAELANYEEVL